MNPTVYRLAFQTLAQHLAEIRAGFGEIIHGMAIPAIVLGVACVMIACHATRLRESCPKAGS